MPPTTQVHWEAGAGAGRRRVDGRGQEARGGGRWKEAGGRREGAGGKRLLI